MVEIQFILLSYYNTIITLQMAICMPMVEELDALSGKVLVYFTIIYQFFLFKIP